MKKLIVLTDLHITAPGERIIGLDPSARLQSVLEAALGAHPDAEAMILMGDLTHHGTVEEYAQLRRLLEFVSIPICAMVGNHDRREAFLQVFPETPVTASGHVQQVRDVGPDHRLICLDTLDGPPYPAGHHAGRLCAARQSWLDDALWGASERVPLVFAHHPPFRTGLPGMDEIMLEDGDRILERLAQAPRAHLFCGHVHRTISGSSRGVPWSMFKSTCHQAPLDLVTVDSSLSIDEPAAYGLLLLTSDGVVAHSEDVGLEAAVARDGLSASA